MFHIRESPRESLENPRRAEFLPHEIINDLAEFVVALFAVLDEANGTIDSFQDLAFCGIAVVGWRGC